MKNKIRQVYDSIAEKFNEQIDHKPHNAYYDRPNTLNLIGECKGRKVLDAACGPGKYAEELIQIGASVTGFDLSPNMIALAKERNKNQGDFFVHDLEQPLVMIGDNSFDIVLCALAMHYIKDWEATIQEFHRVLKSNGSLILSIEHPFFEYNYFRSDNYFDKEHVACTWKGFGQPVEMNSYRRSLTECITPLTKNGFYVSDLVEPRPVKAFELLDPKHFKELNEFPSFLCISAIRK